MTKNWIRNFKLGMKCVKLFKIQVITVKLCKIGAKTAHLRQTEADNKSTKGWTKICEIT